jgi:hypothetical protein
MGPRNEGYRMPRRITLLSVINDFVLCYWCLSAMGWLRIPYLFFFFFEVAVMYVKAFERLAVSIYPDFHSLMLYFRCCPFS